MLPVPARWRYQPVASALWQCLGMDGPTLEKTLHDSSQPRLNVPAAQAVAMACAGNIKAIGLVTERIEGRVGVRRGEAPGEDDSEKNRRQSVIEEIVATLVNARLAEGDDAAPGDNAQVIEGEATRSLAPAAAGRPADERLMPDGDGRTNGHSNGGGWRDREPPRGH